MHSVCFCRKPNQKCVIFTIDYYLLICWLKSINHPNKFFPFLIFFFFFIIAFWTKKYPLEKNVFSSSFFEFLHSEGFIDLEAEETHFHPGLACHMNVFRKKILPLTSFSAQKLRCIALSIIYYFFGFFEQKEDTIFDIFSTWEERIKAQKS